jgi:hypothetical protein
MAKEIIAYCLKTKKKEAMLNATISKKANGGYVAQGVTKDGNKMALIMSEVNALAAIKDGLAKKGF